MPISNKNVVNFLVKKATDLSLTLNDNNTKEKFGLTDSDLEILKSKDSLTLRAYLSKQKSDYTIKADWDHVVAADWDHVVAADWDHVANIHSMGSN